MKDEQNMQKKLTIKNNENKYYTFLQIQYQQYNNVDEYFF